MFSPVPLQFTHKILSFLIIRPPPRSPLFPYTTLFRSGIEAARGRHPRPGAEQRSRGPEYGAVASAVDARRPRTHPGRSNRDRKSTRLNSSHVEISYAVFCLKKKKNVTNCY